ncbi:unnamed protein product [Orchesella dallaii]|uniref:Uncharacterized protein n=1 Tax=Orchesella dallaii TaxID=48710 RepID=A0ABP1PIW5_9HEXA
MEINRLVRWLQRQQDGLPEKHYDHEEPPRKLPKGMSEDPLKQASSPKIKPSLYSSLSLSDLGYLSLFTTLYKPNLSAIPGFATNATTVGVRSNANKIFQKHLFYHQSGQRPTCPQLAMSIPPGKIKYITLPPSALNANLTSFNQKRSTFIFFQNAQLNEDKPLIQKIMLSPPESKKIALALLKRNETALKNEGLRRQGN